MTRRAANDRRATPRSVLVLVGIGALLIVSGVGWSIAERPERPPSWSLAKGKAVPAIDLPDLRDPTKRFTLTGGEPLPVVLNVFSSTCAPCVDELPEIERVARALAGRVRVVGVDHLDRRPAGLALLRRTGVTFPVGFDELGRLATDYRLAGLPATFFVHADGTLADAVLGPIDPDDLERKAKRLRRVV